MRKRLERTAKKLTLKQKKPLGEIDKERKKEWSLYQSRNGYLKAIV